MWKITENKAWKALETQFSWVNDMQGVPQDFRYHAEGDVATHTQMVIAEFAKLPAFQQANLQTQEIFFASALMHDIEKRSTTVFEADGSISSHGHARKGEMTTRKLLYSSIPTPFFVREKIAKMVRYHGLPLWIFEKQNPLKTLFQTSLEINLDWLANLAEADVKGRICADQAELLYKVDLFREFASEQGCLQQPKQFASSLGKFLFFQKEDGFADYTPFDQSNNEVILMSGLPGSGKDTYVQKYCKNWEIVSLDAIRRQMKILPTDTKANGKVIQAAKEMAKKYLRSKTPFVWNATNITRTLRSQLIDLFTTYGAKAKIVYVEVPYQKLLEQNRNRTHIVPENVLHKMISKLEIPSVWEAQEVEYLIRE